MIGNPWHSIVPGKNYPAIVNGVIEIPRGSRAKYEVDKETGMLRLDRVLTTSISYPFHYGFIPQTLGDDDDPLDMLILCSEPLVPLTLVESRVLGIMYMIDQGQKDYKIISAAIGDHGMQHINELADLPYGILEDIHCFFSNYKKAENKKVVVEGFFGKHEAYAVITESVESYKENSSQFNNSCACNK